MEIKKVTLFKTALGKILKMFYNLYVMRLSKNQVDHLAYKIVKTLLKKEYIIADNKNLLVEKVSKVIEDDLKMEEELDEEVKNILLQNSEEMRKLNVDYQEMFRMLKEKLAKERGIIL